MAATACSRDISAPSEPPAPCPLVIGIIVRPGSATVGVGDTARFTARYITYRGNPCVAVELDVPFIWSTTDSAVARVHPDSAVVTARAPGLVFVTARLASDRNFAAGGSTNGAAVGMHLLPNKCLLAVVALLGAASPAWAQAARATAEFSVGTMLGATGGDYYRRTGGAVTAFLGARTSGNSPRSQVLGASLSLVGDPGSGDDCAVAPDGGCLPKFPLLFGLGVEGGWTVGGQLTGTLRLGLGGYWNIKSDGGRGIGVQAQADVAAAPIALVLRGIALPNLHGHTLLIATLTLGLRWN